MTVDLSPKELAVLANLLEQELKELNPEIHHTWVRDYREDLKDYRTTVRDLQQRVLQCQGTAAQSAA